MSSISSATIDATFTHEILEAVQQVVLMIGPDFRVLPECSRYARQMIGAHRLDGADYPDLMLPGEPNAESRALLREWLSLVFQRTDLEWESLAGLNPCPQLEIVPAGASQAPHQIRVSYRPIRSAELPLVERLLVIGSDTTEHRILEDEIARREQENRENLDVVAQILRIDPQVFGNFLAECRALVSEGRARLAGLPFTADPAEGLRTVFRKLHTIKGNARAMGLEWIVRVAHAAEEELLPLRDENRKLTAGNLEPVIEHLKTMHTIVQRYEAVAESVLGQARDRGEVRGRTQDLSVPVRMDRLDTLSTLIRGSQAVAGRENPNLERLQDLLARMAALLNQTRKSPARRLLRRFPKMVSDLAAELGKRVDDTVIEGGDVLVDLRILDKIGDALVHAVRNAVDHGLETPDERVAAGKPEAGRIEIEVREAPEQLTIEIRDDGRGLDVRGIAQQAVKMGLLDEAAAATLDINDAFDLVTSAGFTTARKSSTISGRGVGLDVVRAGVEELGGRMAIKSESGRGCCVQIWIPLSDRKTLPEDAAG